MQHAQMPHSQNARQICSYINWQNGTGIKNSGGRPWRGAWFGCVVGVGKNGSSIFLDRYKIHKYKSQLFLYLFFNNTRGTAYTSFSWATRLFCIFCIQRPFHSNNTAS
jgi:hypothetical protein